MVVNTYDLGTWELEVGRLGAENNSPSCSEFKASLSYNSVLKKKTKKPKTRRKSQAWWYVPKIIATLGRRKQEGLLWLHSVFEINLDFMRLCLKRTFTKK